MNEQLLRAEHVKLCSVCAGRWRMRWGRCSRPSRKWKGHVIPCTHRVTQTPPTHLFVAAWPGSRATSTFASMKHKHPGLEGGVMLALHAQLDSNGLRISICSQLQVGINTAEFPIKLSVGWKSVAENQAIETVSAHPFKAFPDCRSALIKSGFYNHSLIWENHHSSNSKTTSVQWTRPHSHVRWSPTEKVRGCRMIWTFPASQNQTAQ